MAFYPPRYRRGESDFGSHNSKSVFCDLQSLINITKETQDESYSATWNRLLWIYLDISVLFLEKNVHLRNGRNRCNENYSVSAVQFDTHYMWLFIFKVIKMECNKKFLVTVTHFWCSIVTCAWRRLQNISIIEESPIGGHWLNVPFFFLCIWFDGNSHTGMTNQLHVIEWIFHVTIKSEILQLTHFV